LGKCKSVGCEIRKSRRNIAIAVVLIVGVLGVMMYAGILSYTGLPLAGTPGAKVGKTITVTGNYVGPQGTNYGAIGSVFAFDANGNPVSSAALSAAGAFSLNLPSGVSYIFYLSMTGGNAVTYWQSLDQVSIPYVDPNSFNTAYALPVALVVTPKSVAWTETISLSNGAVSGSAAQVYTANAWGGTQTYTAAPAVNLYTAFAAGTTVTITITITVGTSYSAFGKIFQVPNWKTDSYGSAVLIRPLFVFWDNRSDWSLRDPGTANAVFFPGGVNSSATSRAVVGELPVVVCGAVAGASQSVSFSIYLPTAGQGHYGFSPILNSTKSWILNSLDYKVNAPTNYGAVFYGARMVIGHLT